MHDALLPPRVPAIWRVFHEIVPYADDDIRLVEAT